LSGELICCELTAVVSFIPCFYLLFLTVVAAAIIGLFNIPRSERVHQDLSPGVERNVTATKRERRPFMVVPKTKHGSPAKKAANSLPTEKADAKKTRTVATKASSETMGSCFGSSGDIPANPRDVGFTPKS
jgi:uncharacterized protein (DUF58 family)